MSSQTTITIKGPCLLLVEGKDDKAVFDEILKRSGVADIHVVSVGGQDSFEPALELIRNSEELPSVRLIGIVCDSEDDAAKTLERINNALASTNFPTVTGRGVPGLGSSHSVVVYLLPTDRDSGCLESVFIRAVEEIDSLNCHTLPVACLKAGYRRSLEFTEARWDKIQAAVLLSAIGPKYYTSLAFALQSSDFEKYLLSDPMQSLFVIVEQLRTLYSEVPKQDPQ